MWRLIAKALGEKSGSNDKEANVIAGIRFALALLNVITCLVIIANAVRHW